MLLSDKLASLAELCGTKPDPIVVNRVGRFLGLFFRVERFDSELWVRSDGDWWQVMLSPKPFQFIGVDFRKESSLPGIDGDFISWKRDTAGWQLAQPPEAVEIRQRVETSIDLAYRQYRPDTTNT